MSSGERMLPGEVAESVYQLDEKLYVNVTSRCLLHCRFCFKWQARPDFFGHQLLMSREAEPSLEELDRAIRDAPAHSELVFCGLGEPLERFEDVLELAARYKRRLGGRVRVNTSGVMTRPPDEAALARLASCVDCLAISLNAPDEVSYRELCRPARTGAYAELHAFITLAKRLFGTVLLTVVPYPGVDIDACRTVARDHGLPLGLRPYSAPDDEPGACRPPAVQTATTAPPKR